MRHHWTRHLRISGFLALVAVAAFSLAEEQAPKADEQKAEPRKVVVRLIRRKDKQPIPRATVVITKCRYPDGFWWDAPRGEPERLTDKEGRCMVDVPREVSGLIILSAKDGLVPITQDVRWEEEADFQYLTRQGWTHQELRPGSVPAVTVEMEPGETIGGLVTAGQGRPIEGAQVTVAFDHPSDKPDADLLTPSNWSADGDYVSVRVKTDADGRWRCASLSAEPRPNSTLLLRVVHPEYVSDTGGFKRQLSLRTARATTGVVVMKAGASVSGRVRDSEGKPVPSARVVLAYSNDPADSLSTMTDATGRFVVPHADDHPPLWRWVVEVEAAGFAPESKVASPRSDLTPLEFRLTRGRPFHGRVVDRQRRPVAGIDVRPRWDFCDHLAWRAVTDAEGRFVWPDAPRERDFAFELHKAGNLDPIVQVAGKADRVDLTFDPE